MPDQMKTNVVPLRWVGSVDDGYLEMLDQRLLPTEEVWLKMTRVAEVADAIRSMVVRGAPAIGIAAAYGVAMGFREDGGRPSPQDAAAMFELLSTTRPTAVNLFWALDRMKRLLGELGADDPGHRLEALFAEAHRIMDEDRENNLAMGRHGLELFGRKDRVLTHCNTGGLATGGYGTALGVIRTLHDAGRLVHVWVDETRPYLQGARLTAWELMKDGIPNMLITDNMAAYFMNAGLVDAVIVGTDRVTANGDVANKIGTYGLAVLCKHHEIPFYVAAPISTIDFGTATGADIVIEERSPEEVTHIGGKPIAPDGVAVAHPAFDVTPAELVTAIVTERGIARAPYQSSLADLAS